MPVSTLFDTLPETQKSTLWSLRDMILSQDEKVNETVKYGMPCFCYQNRAFCYLWKDKKNGEPYLLFVEGNHLNHPSLIEGDRKRMKSLPVNSAEDLPADLIQSLLNEALNLYRNGIV